MDETLAEIKNKIDIVDLISSYVKLKKTGRNYQALCPFHSEKTPSFNVSPELQIFKCFGCQESGDVFSFMMKIEGLEFPDALRILAEKAGVELKNRPKGDGGSSRREKLYRVNQLAADFYHFLLSEHEIGEKSRNYLIQRGLKKETIKMFSLGYAPSSWDSLSVFLVKKKGFSHSEIVEAGLAVPKKNPSTQSPVYDRFRSRLMFPLKDGLGRVLGFSGRVLGEGTPKYLNSPETPVFHKGGFLYGLDVARQEIKKQDQVFIVEGQFDLISPFQEGLRNIVSSLGTALSEVHLNSLGKFTKRITFIFDQDAAGSQATARSVKIAENSGFTVSAVMLPGGVKDPDEAVRYKKEAFLESVKNSLPFYDYYLVQLTKDLNKNDIREKKRVAVNFLTEVSGIENSLMRSHYVKELARVLKMDESVLADVLGSVNRPREATTVLEKLETVYKTKNRLEILERYFVSLIIRAPADLAAESALRVSPEDFADEGLRNIYSLYRKALSGKNTPVDAKSVRAKLDGLQAKLFDELYLTDLGPVLQSREGVAGELDSVSRQLKKELVRREIEKISLKIKEAEKLHKDGEVELLQRELQKAAEKIK